MKIVQTFWSKPGTGNNLLDNPAGWYSAEYHWMSWALSCLQAKKFYQNVELVTDEAGKEVLINRLQLPYTNVRTDLQSNLQSYPPELWSLAKIYAYSTQQQPFIHIDGDVFIWERFPQQFEASSLLAQNVEANIPYYQNILTAINNRFEYFPEVYSRPLNNGSDIYASNTGVFGGHDLGFIKEYCRQAFEFVDRNAAGLNIVRPEKRPLLNFIFEQYLLYYLAVENNKQINYLLQEEVTDPLYSEFARFSDIPNVPLIHPVGAYKSRPFTCRHVANRLRKEYPDHYYRILDECRPTTTLANKLYYLFKEEPSELAKHTANAPPQITRWVSEFLPASTFYLRSTVAKENIRTEDDKALYLEIYNLEQAKHKLFQQLDEPRILMRLFKNANDQFAQTANLFATASNNEILNTTVCTNRDVVFMELTRNWELPQGEELENFISNKFTEQPTLAQVALWVEPEQLQMQELFMDQLEMIVVSLTNLPVAIVTLLSEITSFFDPHEISQNPQDYERLMIDTIKHLLYLRILVMC